MPVSIRLRRSLVRAVLGSIAGDVILGAVFSYATHDLPHVGRNAAFFVVFGAYLTAMINEIEYRMTQRRRRKAMEEYEAVDRERRASGGPKPS